MRRRKFFGTLAAFFTASVLPALGFARETPPLFKIVGDGSLPTQSWAWVTDELTPYSDRWRDDPKYRKGDTLSGLDMLPES